MLEEDNQIGVQVFSESLNIIEDYIPQKGKPAPIDKQKTIKMSLVKSHVKSKESFHNLNPS